jgi:hypothetical protein
MGGLFLREAVVFAVVPVRGRCAGAAEGDDRGDD